MKNKKLSSEEIKQIELNLLLKLDEICKKYKLRYYLCGRNTSLVQSVIKVSFRGMMISMF